MFSQEEAHAASLEYFNGDELAADVFLGKYALRDDDKNLLEKTPDDMHRRLAREFARIESKYANAMSEEKIFGLFKGFKYVIPQGSPMSSIGNDYQIQSHSNCFVLPNLFNSYGSIFYTDQQQAQIMKRRGGVGFDISNIRPKGMKTRNAAGTTDGIAPFMDRFSNTCREVAQCIAAGEKVLTKRGLIPIEKVIPNKDYAWTRKGWIKVINLFHNGQKDIYRVSTKDGLEIRTSADHIFLTETDGELIEKRVRDFSVGEKAVLLPGPTKPHRVSTNLTRHTNFPTKLNTDLSYLLGITYGDGCVRNYTSRKTGETYPVGIEICCSHEWPTIVDRIRDTVKKVFNYDVNFYHEDDKKATDVYIRSRQIISWLKSNNLLKEKCSDINIPTAILKSSQANQMAFLAGLLDSDGCASSGEYSWTTTSEVASKQIQAILMANGIYSKRSQQKEASLQKSHFKRGFKIRVYGRYGQTLLRKLMGTYSEKVSSSDYTSTRDHQQTPFRVLTTSTSQRYLNATEFLEAKTARPEMYDTELLLTSEIASIEAVGTAETYDLGLESEHLFWCEGFYVHNSGRRGALMLTIDCHHPEIETFINIKRDLKRVTGANISVRWSDEFLEAVESGGEVEMRWPVEKDSERQISKMVNARDIWESFVSSAHASGDPGCLFWDTALRRTPSDCYAEDGFKSVSTNPCGEIVLSGNYDSCRLLCINTLSYVKNPFTKSATFDVELFIQHAREAQRLMDDLIDLEIEAIQKILDKVDSDPEPPYIKQIEKELWEAALATAKAGRRTGLGVTAVGDTIAACGLRYGSAESIEMTEMIYANLALAAYRTTVDLAAERGAFPIFDFKKEEGHPLLEQIWARDPVLFEDYKKHGRRNIALTTTAPTGSVSVMTQTTSGIEPVFMTHYKRRKKINPNDTSLRVDFTDDLGDKWQEYTVYHHGVKAWMDATGETDIVKSPYAGATANEIDWESAVNLQAAAQKWICHAISKTINLPNEATTEDVQKVYWRGWKAGCKGVTVYRDGSKSGVLVADAPNEKRTADGRPIEIVSSHAPKRPETLDCEIHNVKIGGNQWIVLVGLLKGRPYELFAGKAENLVLPKKSKGGKLIKIRRGVYDLHIGEDDDELIVKNVIKAFDNPEMAWTTRLISMALRHGIDCSYVQMQLDKDGLIADINKVLARVIKKYIVDGKKATGVACKACGSANVVFAEGCLTCVDCGGSKCG